jgi:hypothetical protein
MVILEENITVLYHFTDRANINSIKKYGGLFSWHYLETNRIPIPCPGGSDLSRQLDSYHGLHDYVRLCFNRNPPMLSATHKEGRISDPVLIGVHTNVLFLNTTMFSNINANDNSACIGGSLDYFKLINFRLATGTKWDGEQEKKLRQAEVLVKTHVPLKYLSIPE